MPVITCCVDHPVRPPGFAFIGGDVSLPAPLPFAGGRSPAHSAMNYNETPTWSPAHSSSLYKVDAWGSPYFTVNSSGHISIRPYGSRTLPYQEMDLMKILNRALDSISSGGLGLHLPLIVRLPDVLKDRLESLQSSFELAITSQCYRSPYRGVYPVKCNQDRFVVENIVKFGSSLGFGLEAGSKPELLLAMASLSCEGSPDALLICNGFKDAEYISLALVARKLALNTVIVLEQEEELDLVISLSVSLNLRPVIGLRAKLRTKHSGHFGSTSGEKGKFGLSTTQILRVVKRLEQSGMLDCLHLLHFHIGSQIPTTALLSDGVSEAAQIYCELVRLGANMKILDIGGGLGIDYDGSKSSDSEISVSYELLDYAAAVVSSVKNVCDRKFIGHPILCSESGRALVSHHSILIFEAVSAASSSAGNIPSLLSLDLNSFVDGLAGDAANDYRNLKAAATVGDYRSSLLSADSLKQRCVAQFKEGTMNIEQLASADELCDLVYNAVTGDGGASESVRTYQANLSVFRSVPDFWGIGQLFPIVPIHRLDEKPMRRGVLSDLTCDSDGKIDRFIGGEGSLPLHDAGAGSYYLGMFLGGAYEEALGGLHNLFGSPSVARVCASDVSPGGFYISGDSHGSSTGDVLRAMHHQPDQMFETLRRRAAEFSSEKADVLHCTALVPDLLALSFSSTPYLVSSSSARLTAFPASFYYLGSESPCGAAAAAASTAAEPANVEDDYCYVLA